MSAISPLNGSTARPCHSAVDRRPDESLQDFLLRRHDEMAVELATLQAEFTWQGQHLHAQRLTAHRHQTWRHAGLALDATLAMLLALAGIFDAVPASVAAITLIVLLAGNLLAIGMPRLDPVLVGLPGWTPR